MGAQMGCFSVGSKVSFNVTFNKNGHPQAQDLQEVGHARMSQKRSATEMSFDSQYQGVVKKIDFEKGFGFIECQDLKEQFGRDVWVGSEQLGNFGVGSPVAFSVHVNQHGPQAHGLQPIDESVAAEATQRYGARSKSSTRRGIMDSSIAQSLWRITAGTLSSAKVKLRGSPLVLGSPSA